MVERCLEQVKSEAHTIKRTWLGILVVQLCTLGFRVKFSSQLSHAVQLTVAQNSLNMPTCRPGLVLQGESKAVLTRSSVDIVSMVHDYRITQVEEIIKKSKLNTSKSPGPDYIHPKVLRK